MAALVELLMRILTVSPWSVAGRTLFTHGSAPPELLLETGVSVIAEAGKGRGVKVGAGVSVIVAVGGGGVAVGRAVSVCATIVKASAAAVLWMSTAFAVGVACAARSPHELMSSAMMRIRVRFEKYFMGTSPIAYVYLEYCDCPGQYEGLPNPVLCFTWAL